MRYDNHDDLQKIKDGLIESELFDFMRRNPTDKYKMHGHCTSSFSRSSCTHFTTFCPITGPTGATGAT
ncbi:MAG TPA: hypothetical protein DCR67_07360, partial [Brevibacillus sp.]|nr:hypothetical protein [Brevibacillus sp.]